MSQPDTTEQILQSHTGLIHRVVMHCNNPGSVPDLEQVLQQAEENDWKQLVAVIRNIMSGTREESVLLGLDEEDRVIAESILRGLQDPQTLPDLDAEARPLLLSFYLNLRDAELLRKLIVEQREHPQEMSQILTREFLRTLHEGTQLVPRLLWALGPDEEAKGK